MRIERVRARGFGPITDEAIELAPGLTVVYGPNESAKSSWHSAITLGLCGMRRAKGGRRRDDQALVDQHRPWEGDAWSVVTTVRTDDGRLFEIDRDLEVGTALLTALDGGDDPHPELDLEFEGSLDGSRLVGLDRRSFASTACVRQAEVLAVVADPNNLHRHLQRVAAASGGLATAAEAAEALEAFSREQVGLDRANSARPLPLARRSADAAEAALDQARAAQLRFLLLSTSAEQSRSRAEQADAALANIEAQAAREEANDLAQRHCRAAELVARLKEAPPLDTDTAGIEHLVDSYRRCPAVGPLVGRSLDQIDGDLAALPLPPSPSFAPSPQIDEAAAEWERLAVEADAHQRKAPSQPRAGLDPEELRGLAAAADLADAPPNPVLASRLVEADRDLATRRQRLNIGRGLLRVALGLGIAGVAVATINALAGAVLVVAALGLAAIGTSQARGAAVDDAVRRHTMAERAASSDESARREVDRRRHDAIQSLQAAGLATDPDVVRRVAAEADIDTELMRRWVADRAALAAAVGAAEDRLEAALASVQLSGPVGDSLSFYRSARDAQPARAALLRERQQRVEVEARGREIEATRAGLEQELRRRVGDDASTSPDALVDLLERRCSSVAAARLDSQRLEDLLGDTTFAELERQALQAKDLADRKAAALAPTRGDLITDRMSREEAQRIAQAARREADELAGELRAFPSADADVATAEATLAEAERALNQVEQLGEVLSATRHYLRQAEQRAYRQVAPILAERVGGWLSAVTGGRYDEVVVRPESLEVQVRADAGKLRAADRLSHGTTEQIYLLLRLALVEQLTSTGETCPVLVDDPTVNADPARNEAMLDLLHRISRDRQIVLFTMQPAVADWARRRLGEGLDRLLTLDRLALVG